MGSRSSFKNVHSGDFSFVDGGKTFRSIGGFDNVKILVRDKQAISIEKALVNEIKERFGLR